MTRLEKHLHVGVAVAATVRVGVTGVTGGAAAAISARVAAAQRVAITITVHPMKDQLSNFGRMTDGLPRIQLVHHARIVGASGALMA